MLALQSGPIIPLDLYQLGFAGLFAVILLTLGWRFVNSVVNRLIEVVKNNTEALVGTSHTMDRIDNSVKDVEVALQRVCDHLDEHDMGSKNTASVVAAIRKDTEAIRNTLSRRD